MPNSTTPSARRALAAPSHSRPRPRALQRAPARRRAWRVPLCWSGMPTVDAAAPSRRWVMWTLPALLFFVGFFHRAAPGVIARDLMQAFAISGVTVGWLAGAYFYTYAGLMIPAGLLVDTYGVRRVMTVGGAVMGAGALMATVGVLGALVSTLPLAALVAAVGWRGAFAGVGLVTLAFAALGALGMRDRPPGAAADAAARLRDVLAGAGRVLRNPHTWPP